MELDSDDEDLENQAPPPPATDPRLNSHYSTSHLYGEIRHDPRPFHHSASARGGWNIPTQTYGYPVFRARPDPGVTRLPPPVPPVPPVPPPPPVRPLLNSSPLVDIASVPLPPQPLLSHLPPRPAPPIADTPPLNSIPLPAIKPELIDLSSPEKKDPKEVFIVSSDSVSHPLNVLAKSQCSIISCLAAISEILYLSLRKI